jgi:ABC-type transport system involved in cytochrome c biogenesis permease subunit
LSSTDPSASLAAALVATCTRTSAVGFVAWYRPRWKAVSHLADGLGLVCLAVGISAWIVRWVAAGHLPLFGTYESSLSLAVATLVAGLLSRKFVTGPAGLWSVACGMTAILVAHGLRYDMTVYALTISERSWVVDVHAVAAWAAFGVLVVNLGFAARLLFGGAHEIADRGLVFSLSLGFVLHTALMVSGSFYKFLLFGTVWSFDPIETMGLVTWMAYGTLLHMHLFVGWSGRRLARWCLGLFVVLLISYRGIVYFPAWSTYHILDMDLRMHLTGSEKIEPPMEP